MSPDGWEGARQKSKGVLALAVNPLVKRHFSLLKDAIASTLRLPVVAIDGGHKLACKLKTMDSFTGKAGKIFFLGDALRHEMRAQN